MEYKERRISVQEYLDIRNEAGWFITNSSATRVALDSSLYSVVVVENDNVVGLGRVIGDGGIYFYIQDVIVHPDYRKMGIGTRVMEMLLDYINLNTTRGAFVGVFAAFDLGAFYEKFGFTRSPKEALGMYYIKS